MFDIGFPELVIVSVVALLVVGPDKLPGTIRTISLWVGRFRRSFSNIKQDIEKEIGADEIRSQLYNESIMEDLEKTKDTFTDMKNDVNKAINDIDSSVSDLASTASSSQKSSSQKSRHDTPLIDESKQSNV